MKFAKFTGKDLPKKLFLSKEELQREKRSMTDALL